MSTSSPPGWVPPGASTPAPPATPPPASSADAGEIARLRAENAELQRAMARDRIAAEIGLDSELTDFLTGDEAAMRAQAEKLKGKTAAAAPPAQGGTSTQPPREAAPSIDEQIDAAYKAGRNLEAIRLRREKAFGG